MNKQLSEATSADVELLREELIACKVREAENDLLTKELKQKVMELDKVFQVHASLRQECVDCLVENCGSMVID